MKDYKVVPSTNGVATVQVAGQTRHYFQSEKLGSCYAFKPTPPDYSRPPRKEDSECWTYDYVTREYIYLCDDEPTPPEKSHVDLVNEAIDEFEDDSR